LHPTSRDILTSSFFASCSYRFVSSIPLMVMLRKQLRECRWMQM
jgi:hypothetical protein